MTHIATIHYNTNLSSALRQSILARFPTQIKLSYEIVSHKKVSSEEYNLGIAVPYGQRAYIWFTFFKNEYVCCVCELTRTNIIGERVYFAKVPIPPDFMLGTIISGVFLQDRVVADFSENVVEPTYKTFLIDNMYAFKGVPMSSYYTPCAYDKKIQWIFEFLKTMDSMYSTCSSDIVFSVPVMWKYDSTVHKYDVVPMQTTESVGYTVKHIQYMCTTRVAPLLNVAIHKKPIWNPTLIADNDDNDENHMHNKKGVATIDDDLEENKENVQIWKTFIKKYVSPIMPEWNYCLHRPIYSQKCFFWVKADLAYDVYHLYTKRSKPFQGEKLLYAYAFVPDMKTSLFLNGIFRSIKENRNLDSVEESDDEEEFENIAEDRFVQLEKTVLMECKFDRKFKKWVPIQIAPNGINGFRVVPYLEQLIIRG
tara:strand:+ start:34 stop:1302 length:1269 start_codon:yes stop_codon:yes gene_type:complete